MNQWIDKMKGKISMKEVKKPAYQIYDKITVQEVDDVSNYAMPHLPESILYESKKLKEKKILRFYKTTSRDYAADSVIRIHALQKEDVTQEEGYYNIAAIQIMAKWLGNTGLDIPFSLSVRDLRQLDPKQQIIGLWSTNLFTGSVYTEIFCDITASATYENLTDLIVIDAKANINQKERSRALSISLKMYYSWVETHFPYRARDRKINANNRLRGETVIVKSSQIDGTLIPQPIPVEKLRYDLEFNFEKDESQLEVKQSVEPEYILKGRNSVAIRLKEPQSSIKPLRKWKNDAGPSQINEDDSE